MSPSRTIRHAGVVLSTFDMPGASRRSVCLGYLVANVFELLIVVLTTIANVVYLANRGAFLQTSLGKATQPYDLFWTVLFLVGGVFVTFGLLRPSPRLEVMGLFTFGAGVIANAVAITSVAGVPGVAPAAGYIGLVLASAVRIRAITWVLR